MKITLSAIPSRAAVGWLLAGTGWVLHLAADFRLGEWYCSNERVLALFDTQLLLHGLTLVSLALTLAALVLSVRHLALLSLTERDEDGNVVYSRARLFVLGAIIFSLYASTAILMKEWGNFLLPPCAA